MKHLGTLLIIAGVFVIFYGLIYSTQVFLQGKEPPEVFKPQEISVNELLDIESSKESGSFEEEAIEVKDIDLEEVLPISRFFNILAVSLFVMIFIFGGAKLVTAGVSILKER